MLLNAGPAEPGAGRRFYSQAPCRHTIKLLPKTSIPTRMREPPSSNTIQGRMTRRKRSEYDYFPEDVLLTNKVTRALSSAVVGISDALIDRRLHDLGPTGPPPGSRTWRPGSRTADRPIGYAWEDMLEGVRSSCALGAAGPGDPLRHRGRQAVVAPVGL